MALAPLREFLDENDVRYVIITHSLAYTAQEVAASAHISGKELAKTVIVKVDGKMVMAVLPASDKIDFGSLQEALGASEVELAHEEDFADMFPDCEVGAMPPFGNLYDMEVLVASTLAEDEEVAFNAGTHRELIRMAYRDYEKLAQPRVVDFSQRTHI